MKFTAHKILVKQLFLLLGMSFISAVSTAQVVTPAAVFQSQMVLQQENPITIWGTAKQGDEIVVSFGDEAQKTITNQQGQWQVTFSSRKASFEPHTLTINTLVFEDILIGEVWICSGQSNMVRTLRQSDGGMEAFKDSNQNAIRILHNRHPRLVAPKGGYFKSDLERSNTLDFFDGKWAKTTVENIGSFSAIGWRFGAQISAQKNVPLGLILLAVGGSAINNWISPQSLKSNPLTASYFTKDWLTNEDVDRGHRKRGKDAFQNVIEAKHPYIIGETAYRWMCEPGFLFEAGIAPLKHLNFKGVLWYQGETDAITDQLVERYKTLFPLMVKDWRSYFSQGDFPFIYVQLPRFKKITWPEFRNNQRLAKKTIDNSFMVVSIDLGMKDDIHPTDKLPIADRAADIALTHVYSIKIKGTQTAVKSIQKKGSILKIKLTEDLFSKGNSIIIPGFEISDVLGNYKKTTAKFLNKRTLVVDCETNSQFIRYGWQPYPIPNLILFSKNGSPLSPFKESL
jgi:sialate O-acetylesterase|tara:strand:- start:2120 stop:3652 length:1533 start_codon:yes stop_codon:yes gene_type:complete